MTLVSEIVDGMGNRIRRFETLGNEEETPTMQLRILLSVRSENAGITVRDVENWYWKHVGTTHTEIFVLPTEEDSK